MSYGELLDKISILEIKQERIADPARKARVTDELDLLRSVWRESRREAPEVQAAYRALKDVNLRLWTIEDDIRDLESRKDFGSAFIELARAVYQTNDRRSSLKDRINTLTQSSLSEQKLYSPY
ncbi:DUF6165 family protein [Labrys neptuniae]